MRFEIGLGVGFDRSGQAIDPAHAAVVVREYVNLAAEQFGGCNLVRGVGAWKGANGVVVEDSITLTIDGSSQDQQRVQNFAHAFAKDLNQRAYHFTVMTCWPANIEV
jgi:hypothetical protein